MGLLRGSMTARRFRVVGDLPDDWRTTYRDRLDKMAFREPDNRTGKEEVEGWVQIHNLLDTDFTDLNRWLYNHLALFTLRVDKKTLPAKLVRATVEVKCREWAEERQVDRVPAAVKKEIKEMLEADWLKKALPSVRTTDVCWNIQEGWVTIDSHSETTGDRLRKRFHRTFGLELVPWSPLDAVSGGDLREALLATSPTLAGGDA